jgi:hypothetical protein
MREVAKEADLRRVPWRNPVNQSNKSNKGISKINSAHPLKKRRRERKGGRCRSTGGKWRTRKKKNSHTTRLTSTMNNQRKQRREMKARPLCVFTELWERKEQTSTPSIQIFSLPLTLLRKSTRPLYGNSTAAQEDLFYSLPPQFEPADAAANVSAAFITDK